jgi:predicted amidophosphoribosyltransferase
MALLPRVLEAALDTVFPPRCVARGCGRRGAWLCSACLTSVLPVPNACPVCAGARCACRPGLTWSFERAIAAGLYQGALRDAVRALKFRAVAPLAEPLGALAAYALRRAVCLSPGAVFVPVPGHPERTAARGVDHTRLLAESAGRAIELPVRTDLLRRAGAPARQVGLSAAERAANLAGAFRLSGVAPPCVVVVDDVFTTGATAQAAASVFRSVGTVVFVAVVARSDRVTARTDEPRSRLNDRRDAGAPL